jgi:hypothetical protein
MMTIERGFSHHVLMMKHWPGRVELMQAWAMLSVQVAPWAPVLAIWWQQS